MKLELINEYLFTKHHIAPGTQAENIEEVARDHVGLHAARIMTPYTTLCSRLKDYTPQMLSDGLCKDKNLVKLRCMRTTLHIAPHDMADTLHMATLGIRTYGCLSYFKKNSIPLDVVDETWLLVRPELSKLNKTEDLKNLIKMRLGKEVDQKTCTKMMLKYFWETGRLSYVNTADNWEREERKYAVTDEFYPTLSLGQITTDEAKNNLVHRYIKSFGPVTPKDFAWWSGLGQGTFTNFVNQSKGNVERIKCKDSDLDLFVMADEIDLIAKHSPEKSDWVSLLAFEDPALKGYKESRCRYVSPQKYNKLFNQIGEVKASIIHNGQAIGTWTWDKKTKQVVLDYFDTPSAGIKAKVSELKQKYETILAPQTQQLWMDFSQ